MSARLEDALCGTSASIDELAALIRDSDNTDVTRRIDTLIELTRQSLAMQTDIRDLLLWQVSRTAFAFNGNCATNTMDEARSIGSTVSPPR